MEGRRTIAFIKGFGKSEVTGMPSVFLHVDVDISAARLYDKFYAENPGCRNAVILGKGTRIPRSTEKLSHFVPVDSWDDLKYICDFAWKVTIPISKPIICRLLNGRVIASGEFLASDRELITGELIWHRINLFLESKAPGTIILNIGLEDDTVGKLLHVKQTPDTSYDLSHNLSFHVIAIRSNMASTGGRKRSHQRKQ